MLADVVPMLPDAAVPSRPARRKKK